MDQKSTSEILDYEARRNKQYFVLVLGAVLAMMIWYLVIKPLVGE